MGDLYKKVIGDLLASKKFRTQLTGAILCIVARLGLEGYVGPEDAQQIALYILGLFSVGTLAQGAADFGKEAKKVEVQ